MKMKYSNHESVLSFGHSQINKHIENVDKYEQWGSQNALLGIREGIDIVFRLGESFEKELLVTRLNEKLDQMKVDKENYLTSEDRSAMSYLDHTRREHAISLFESYINYR